MIICFCWNIKTSAICLDFGFLVFWQALISRTPHCDLSSSEKAFFSHLLRDSTQRTCQRERIPPSVYSLRCLFRVNTLIHHFRMLSWCEVEPCRIIFCFYWEMKKQQRSVWIFDFGIYASSHWPYTSLLPVFFRQRLFLSTEIQLKELAKENYTDGVYTLQDA